ncbi:uncharacterized protein BYT42DRAFT_615546 [Radiomyces spectabilis]|uniref:uncharacterized protein n=1 Tax=Radiomyces spectabilis TaxID=64574 RepID=UPI00221EAEB9|nr:uncharacterized protein BYT42DRAFT_615546 [Radiomyces spectabilis]KAI8374375.1 hypothetical protein BYT42DRAFT_615546 [Radiomyces spectabilis]
MSLPTPPLSPTLETWPDKLNHSTTRHQRSHPNNASLNNHHHHHHHHSGARRRDCYDILQAIIKENERREQEEYEKMIREIPNIINRHSHATQSILRKRSDPLPATPPQSPDSPNSEGSFESKRSVRFAAGPPKISNGRRAT